MDEEVTFRSVTEAARVLQGVALVTPVVTSRYLDAEISGNVFLKCENFQRTGAFKFRGAYHALWQVKSRGIATSVATISSGNHGQGIALASALLGFSAHVVMPQPVSPWKRHAVAGYGARVTLTENRLIAEEKIRDILAQQNAIYVHAFNNPHVMAGQGTVILEFLDQVGSLDILLAPVGGGGLLSGLCIAGHHLQTALKIFACEPTGASDAEESIRLNQVVPMPHPNTLADGLRTSLGSRTLPILRDHLAGILHVSEEEIIRAVRFAQERLELVIEPSSAVALAPILRGEAVLRGKRVGVVLTGGNVDLNELWSALERHGRRGTGD